MKTLDRRLAKEWKKHVELLKNQTSINYSETKKEKLARIERAKNDYNYFVQYYLPSFAKVKTPEWHIKASNKIKKSKEISIWLKWGRGLAKSVLADVSVPLWIWINNDISFMLLIGQEQEKASILLDDLRLQFEGNQRIINDFGVQKKTGYWESGFFITQNNFIAKSMGMGQEPRGLRVGSKRPDYIVCDDWETKETLKNPKRQDDYANWLLTGIIPTMDEKNQRVILAQNQFAPRMIFSKIVQENKGWTVHKQNAFDPVTLKPYWSEKYPSDYYEKKIQIMGMLEANAEYNNDPHVKGKIFTDEMIQWAKLPRLNSFKTIVGTWDIAFSGSATSDFNAIRVWGLKDGKKYLIDCYVRRSKIKPAIEWIADFQKKLPTTVSVPFRFEAQFHNDEIYRIIEETEKKHEICLNLVKSDRPKKKKYDRMLEMHPHYQNGRVYYNEKLKSHNDTKEGLAQLRALEPGYRGNDDAPDADKEAFDYLDTFQRSIGRKWRLGEREQRSF